MRPIRIALTKGRLEKKSVELFTKMGLDCSALIDKGRRLILPVGDYEVVLAKAADVITYVEHGVCDIGIVGKDTIAEHSGNFYEVSDLGIGKCDFALAGPKGKDFFSGYNVKRIATKYPTVARNLADAIVDIVETGTTLKENGLEVIEKVMPISARVIVNMASMKLRKDEIEKFLTDIDKAKESVK